MKNHPFHVEFAKEACANLSLPLMQREAVSGEISDLCAAVTQSARCWLRPTEIVFAAAFGFAAEG
jgi:hypothetical protein